MSIETVEYDVTGRQMTKSGYLWNNASETTLKLQYDHVEPTGISEMTWNALYSPKRCRATTAIFWPRWQLVGRWFQTLNPGKYHKDVANCFYCPASLKSMSFTCQVQPCRRQESTTYTPGKGYTLLYLDITECSIQCTVQIVENYLHDKRIILSPNTDSLLILGIVHWEGKSSYL